MAQSSAELARDGLPRKPFYLTGRIGDQSISLHAEGEKVVLTNAGCLNRHESPCQLGLWTKIGRTTAP